MKIGALVKPQDWTHYQNKAELVGIVVEQTSSDVLGVLIKGETHLFLAEELRLIQGPRP